MRPRKARIIDEFPQWKRFFPEGRTEPEETIIGFDMFEALRLVDALGLSQEDAARSMDISAPTLCRLVGEARTRIARALCAGRAIRVEGGNVIRREGSHGRSGPPDTADERGGGRRGGRGMGKRRGMLGMGRHGADFGND